MPYLIECHEWRLLQALGALLEEWKAPYEPQHQIRHEVPANSIQTYHKLFEIELRRIFIPKVSAPNLPRTVFEESQLRLGKLCGLLDSLVKRRLISSNLAHTAGWSELSVADSTYPLLQGLIRYLEGLNRTASNLQAPTELFDLASGPHQILFRLPEDTTELKNELKIVTECNDFVDQLFTTNRESPHRSTPKAKGQAWTDTRLRDHAATLLGTLFKRFKCGIRHEIMLKLSDSDKGIPRPKLHLLLSSCPNSDRWQEALYDSCE
jgi:hypothetical protein